MTGRAAEAGSGSTPGAGSDPRAGAGSRPTAGAGSRPTAGARPAAASVATLAAAALLSGCLDIAAPEARPAGLSVNVEVEDGDPTAIRVQGSFAPGTTGDGTEREVADPRLRVLGRALSPSETHPGGGLSWEDSWEPDPSLLDRPEGTVLGPRLAGDGSAPTVSAPLVSRAGPASVRVPPGADLALPLQDLPGPTAGPDRFYTWRVEVRDPDPPGTLFRAGGTGIPPDTLVVQREHLEGSLGDGPLEADLTFRTSDPGRQGDGRYDVSMTWSTVVTWQVLGE